ncbi:DUF72 domain-containing protein [Sphingobacterium sp.]|uniref:DUF72 domain-containing protein n=1 Tax=Sphingobacterium sp. TaxID=341027 RepID=UPI0031D6247A
MKAGKIYIGTSGWHYKHWKDFYPKDIKQSEQLAYLANMFSTVEINNSFYKLPTKETFENWRKEVPDDFIFAIKGSQFISHMKKLKVNGKSINDFLDHAKCLKSKLGPVLFQLPPRWKVNAERLRDFLQLLPRTVRFTFEFRDHSWNTSEIYNLLEQYRCAYCIYNLAGYQSPYIITSDFVYIRLHGPDDKYEGSYSKSALTKWAENCLAWQTEGKDVYLFFDNDQNAFATKNALTLLSLLR